MKTLKEILNEQTDLTGRYFVVNHKAKSRVGHGKSFPSKEKADEYLKGQTQLHSADTKVAKYEDVKDYKGIHDKLNHIKEEALYEEDEHPARKILNKLSNHKFSNDVEHLSGPQGTFLTLDHGKKKAFVVYPKGHRYDTAGDTFEDVDDYNEAAKFSNRNK